MGFGGVGRIAWPRRMVHSQCGLNSAIRRRQKKISQQNSTINQITGNPEHPNEQINHKVRKENKALAQEVYQHWNSLYVRQKEELKWPKGDLSERFLDKVVDNEFGSAIPQFELEEYRTYVHDLIKKLPKIIEARAYDPKTAGPRSAARRVGSRLTVPFVREREPLPTRDGLRSGRQPDQSPEEPWVVEWHDQDRLYDEYHWPDDPPYPYEVWTTQEDLWVYQALLTIIKNTNQGATGQHNAAIKEIDTLQVGTEASKNFDSKDQIASEMPRAESSDLLDRSLGEDRTRGLESLDPSRREFGRGNQKPTEEERITQLLNGRYLDVEGKPIFGSFTAEDELPNEPKEYKRLPIFLELKMNLDKLDTLLVECANYPLPIEVTQIRINPTSGSGRSRSRGGGLRDMRDLGRREELVSRQQPIRRTLGRNDNSLDQPNPALGTVVLKGIVDIYKNLIKKRWG